MYTSYSIIFCLFYSRRRGRRHWPRLSSSRWVRWGSQWVGGYCLDLRRPNWAVDVLDFHLTPAGACYLLLTPGLATNSIFFWFLFVKKIIDQWPLVGKTLFTSVPPSNSNLCPWRAFWADLVPFKGPPLASYVASGTTKKQGHRQVCRVRQAGPRRPLKPANANLDCSFFGNALFYTDPWWWKVNRIVLS